MNKFTKIALCTVAAVAASGAFAQSDNGAELNFKSDLGTMAFTQDAGNSAHAAANVMGISVNFSEWRNGVGNNAYFAASTSANTKDIRYSNAVKPVDDASYSNYRVGYLRSLDNLFIASLGAGLSYDTYAMTFKSGTAGVQEKIKTDSVNFDVAVFTRKQQMPGVYWNAMLSIPVWSHQSKADWDGKVSLQPTAKLSLGHMFDSRLFVELGYERAGMKADSAKTVLSGSKTVSVEFPRTVTRKTMLSVGYLF